MQYARYRTDSGIWERVSADEYDPQKHGDELCCADPSCEARVYFRSVEAAHGASYDEKTFASVRRADHRDGCPQLSYTQKTYNDVTLDEAVEKGYHVLLNMNFDLGHPSHASLGRRVSNDVDTPYNQWRGKYPHATLRAKNIREYFGVISKVLRAGPEMLESLRIGHMQDVRHYSTFFIDDKKIMFQRLFEEMSKGDEGFGNMVVGFPRHITFRPLKSEFERGREAGAEIRGNAIVMGEHQGARHFLFNRLVLASDEMRPEILSHDFNDVLAVPMLNKVAVRGAAEKYERGETAAAFLDWSVVSGAQYQPAQGAYRYGAPLQDQGELPGLLHCPKG